MFRKLLEKLLPRQLNTEVKYVPGKNFKLTVTAYGDVRIKIPIGTNSNVERVWIQRCKDIGYYFLKNPYQSTLRAASGAVSSNLSLKTDSKKCIFNVLNSEVVKRKKAV